MKINNIALLLFLNAGIAFGFNHVASDSLKSQFAEKVNLTPAAIGFLSLGSSAGLFLAAGSIGKDRRV